ncbi:MAG: 50S ribosomal protein L28 [Alphaproteobacteria bacterium]|nr:50S ribosomal protein L28 [Alphaproteobacteria bacterium]
MTRMCELTGKGVQYGNRRSHAENKTRRVFRPNLHAQRLYSDILAREVKLRISARALRTVDSKGGIDQFLLGTNDSRLPAAALVVKKAIVKRGGKPVFVKKAATKKPAKKSKKAKVAIA